MGKLGDNNLSSATSEGCLFAADAENYRSFHRRLVMVETTCTCAAFFVARFRHLTVANARSAVVLWCWTGTSPKATSLTSTARHCTVSPVTPFRPVTMHCKKSQNRASREWYWITNSNFLRTSTIWKLWWCSPFNLSLTNMKIIDQKKKKKMNKKKERHGGRVHGPGHSSLLQ